MRDRKFNARMSPEVARLGIKVVFLSIEGLRNRDNDPYFSAIRDQSQNVIKATLDPDFADHDPILAGYRELHAAVEVSSRKNVASPETLLRLLLKRGSLPQINLLVDIYNLVSVETRLSLGAHDLKHVEGDVELRLTSGSERFHPLGQPEAQPVRAGEYAYVDEANDVLCRLEVRQAEKSKITAETTDCFLIIQGNRATDDSLLRTAADRLSELTARFCGGEHRIVLAPWM
jgi:DNA/RNA-binding domain of Phe-tRNA-synthetase-like protein